MTLNTSHVAGDPNHPSEHNALATQVNQNTTDIAARETAAHAAATYETQTHASATYQAPDVLMVGAGIDLTGATDSTFALQAKLNAAAAGNHVHFPTGTYLMDGLTVSKKLHLTFAGDAVLKQRVAPTLTGGVGATLRLASGSNGTTVTGLKIDGNRVALSGSFTPGTFWIGLRVESASNITVRDAEIYNVMCHGVYCVTGTNLALDNIYVHDSAQALGFEDCHSSSVRGIYADNISNNGYSVWQHAFELRQLTRCKISDLRLGTFSPDGTARDNLSLGIDASRLDKDCSISDVFMPSYSGTGRLGVGIVVGGATDLTLANIHITDFHGGITLQGVYGCTVSNVHIDGAYKTSSSHGLKIIGAGYDQTVTAGADTQTNAASRGVAVLNSVIKAAYYGAYCTSSDVKFVGVHSIGNTQYGYLIQAHADNSANFPGAATPKAAKVILDSCSAVANGYSGLYADTNTDVTVIGGSYVNNGQNTGAPDRHGIVSAGPSNALTVQSSPGIYDEQSWSKVGGGSIQPATYTAGTCWMQMLDPSSMYVGQQIVVKNITGAADATVKILQLVGDNALIDYAGTVADTGNLTALTGTVAVSGTTMTGTGTSFTTQLTGRSWIKIGTSYYLVVAVTSNTSATLYQGGTVGAGASASRVGFTVNGIPSQQTGLLLSGTFGEALIGRIADRANVSKPMDFAYASAGNAKPGTFLSMWAPAVTIAGSSSPALIGSIPPGFRVVGTRIEVTTPISGGGATNYDLKLYDNGVLKETYATAQSLAAGTNNRYAAGTQIDPGPGTLYMFVNGGVPTAGVVNAEIIIERCGA